MEDFYEEIIDYMEENNLEEISIDDIKKFNKKLNLEELIEELNPKIAIFLFEVNKYWAKRRYERKDECDNEALECKLFFVKLVHETEISGLIPKNKTKDFVIKKIKEYYGPDKERDVKDYGCIKDFKNISCFFN